MIRGDDAGPPGLVARAEAGPVVSVEVLVKQYEIAPVRILLELSGAAINRPVAVMVPPENASSAVARSPRRPDTDSCVGRIRSDIRL